jgi:predicted GNAT family acetyltransferase
MVQVRHSPGRQRYEAVIDGRLVGFASYREQDNDVLFDNTAVQPAYRGRGVAHQLVQEAIADVRRRDKQPIGVCPFVAGVLDRDAQLVS